MTATRISIVTETYVPDVNGVANSLRHLIQSLDRDAYRIQIIRTSPKQHWLPQEEEIWTTGVTIPMYPDLQLGLPARQTIAAAWQQFQPDLIFIATEGPLGYSALKEAQRRDLPVLSAFHTNFHRYSSYYGFGWIRSLTLNWLRRFHNRTLATLVPSRDSADFLQRAKFNNVKVLPHGVDCELFHPKRRSTQLREQWQVRADQPVALYVGRIAAEKNIPQVIASFRHCQKQHPDLRLVMVGDGPMRAELEQQHPDIIFAGVQTGEMLARHYASADCFVFASTTETFGLVTLEAMASALPVVAYPLAAAGQYVTSGIHGCLAASESPDAFTEAFQQLLQLDLLTTGQAARTCAEQASWTAVAALFDQQIKQALRQVSEPVSASVQTMV
ncbi:glycosyltransferase family 4 protein [Bacterioplanoides sp.]|uniref:glycosyltransferase family 4 protein n=1 Tax=Bacterioplanoides sp. TaxID=2066072 RepID=UPI003B006803